MSTPREEPASTDEIARGLVVASWSWSISIALGTALVAAVSAAVFRGVQRGYEHPQAPPAYIVQTIVAWAVCATLHAAARSGWRLAVPTGLVGAGVVVGQVRAFQGGWPEDVYALLPGTLVVLSLFAMIVAARRRSRGWTFVLCAGVLVVNMVWTVGWSAAHLSSKTWLGPELGSLLVDSGSVLGFIGIVLTALLLLVEAIEIVRGAARPMWAEPNEATACSPS